MPFALFSRSIVSTFTLGRNVELLTTVYDILGYRHAITKWRPPVILHAERFLMSL